jgi:2-iminobutanoate/2-iminopropanoate deaminase
MLGLKSETWKTEMRAIRKIYKTIIALALSTAFQSCFANSVEYIISDESTKLNLPFSDAVVFGETLVMSGQLGVNPATFALVDGGIESETHQIFSNMTSILAIKNATLEDIVKCTVMIADIAEWPAFNVIYSSYFPGPKPARSALGANGLALGARVELECWASLSE